MLTAAGAALVVAMAYGLTAPPAVAAAPPAATGNTGAIGSTGVAGNPETAGSTGAGASTFPEMIEALQRDLNLTEKQVTVRLAKEQAAAQVQARLRAELGDRFGGAWLTADDQRLVVAITDAAEAGRVTALGAQPRMVARSERELARIMARLDAVGAPPSVSSWYIDVENNTIVVQANQAGIAAAGQLMKASGIDPAAVRVQVSSEAPRPLYDLRGGDKIGVPGGSCSLGFSIREVVTGDDPPGYVTAGHCLDVGDPTTGFNGEAQGITRGSVFPGTGDYAWVLVNSNWTPRPWVNRYGGADRFVHGATPAPVSASVCRSGITTGWKCGVVQALNATVNYPDGSVSGLTRTSACADRGDSGGSFIAVTQAQGVTSGGDIANCRIYFQPVQEILDDYNLRLVTTRLPQIINLICEYGGNALFTCHLSYASPTAATVRWTLEGTPRSDWNDKTSVSGGCALNTTVTVRATVTNPDGSATASSSFRCFGEPL